MKKGITLISLLFFALQVSAARYEIYKLDKGSKGFASRQESISDGGSDTNTIYKLVCKDQGTYSGDAPRLRNNTFKSPSGKVYDIYALYLALEEMLTKSPKDLRITSVHDEGIIYLAQKDGNSIVIKIYTASDAVTQKKYLEFK